MDKYFYRVFGIILESDVPFPELTPSTIVTSWNHVKHIVFRKKNFCSSPPSQGWVSSASLAYWLSPDRHVLLVRSPSSDLFKIDLVKKTIDWQAPQGKNTLNIVRTLVSLRILGLLLTHLAPSLLLHACVIVIREGGVGFIGPSGQGKSTMAADFLNQGFPLLSDDAALIQKEERRFCLQPGPSEIRLWPSTSTRLMRLKLKSRLLHHQTKKRRFTLGRGVPRCFEEKRVPLRALYLLSRNRNSSIRIEPLKGQEALIALSRNNYNRIVETPNVLRQQLQLMTQVLQKIPLKRLVYPSGFSYLPKVTQAILSDLGFC